MSCVEPPDIVQHIVCAAEKCPPTELSLILNTRKSNKGKAYKDLHNWIFIFKVWQSSDHPCRVEGSCYILYQRGRKEGGTVLWNDEGIEALGAMLHLCLPL